jgi:hypothetical protein
VVREVVEDVDGVVADLEEIEGRSLKTNRNQIKSKTHKTRRTKVKSPRTKRPTTLRKKMSK